MKCTNPQSPQRSGRSRGHKVLANFANGCAWFLRKGFFQSCGRPYVRLVNLFLSVVCKDFLHLFGCLVLYCQAFIQALLCTTVYPQRFSFFTVCLVQGLRGRGGHGKQWKENLKFRLCRSLENAFFSDFPWNLRVYGVLKKIWLERCLQLSFMRVCKYLNQRVWRIGK